MFSINEMKAMNKSTEALSGEKKETHKNKQPSKIYTDVHMSPFIECKNDNEINTLMIDRILENEKQHNKTESWNKLNKTNKLKKLNIFAVKYCKEHGLTRKEETLLKTFFEKCLEHKLNKTKDLVYNKEIMEIESIPSLAFNHETRNFTLKNVDKQRVSTLKSLTLKKTAPIPIPQEIKISSVETTIATTPTTEDNEVKDIGL